MSDIRPTWWQRCKAVLPGDLLQPLLLAVLGVSLIPLAVWAARCTSSPRGRWSQPETEKLEAIRTIKARTSWTTSTSVRDQLLTLAEGGMTVQAMQEFRQALAGDHRGEIDGGRSRRSAPDKPAPACHPPRPGTTRQRGARPI